MILGFFDNALYVWTHTHVRMVSITYCISYPVVRKSQYFQAQSKTTWVETIGQIAWCRPDTLLILHGQYIYIYAYIYQLHRVFHWTCDVLYLALVPCVPTIFEKTGQTSRDWYLIARLHRRRLECTEAAKIRKRSGRPVPGRWKTKAFCWLGCGCVMTSCSTCRFIWLQNKFEDLTSYWHFHMQ